MDNKKTMTIDSGASRIAIRTRAAGLLSRFAHDLELVTTSVSGHAEVEADSFAAEVFVPVRSIRVVGVLHGDRVDPAALSSSDRLEIERRIREETLPGTNDVICRVSTASHERGDVTVLLSRSSARTSFSQEVFDKDSSVDIMGRCRLSLRALSIPEIKGPLGVFRIKDEIEIIYDLTLRPSEA